ncbi:hypothetical protein Ancab_035122 [Ancistrocladus abbreviatus]
MYGNIILYIVETIILLLLLTFSPLRHLPKLPLETDNKGHYIMSCHCRSDTCFPHHLHLLLLLLLLSLSISSIFFSFSNASPHLQHLQTIQPSEVIHGDGYSEVISWRTRRSVAEVADNSSLILAKSRTYRRDPFDGFKEYTGGWNISNKHYWASVGFTAAPFFVIAAAWFVIFGLTLFCICLYFSCCRKEPYGYSRACYALSLFFLILFTLAAIFGCIVLYTGQGKFNSSTTNTLDYVVSQADVTNSNLKNVSEYLSSARNIHVDQIYLPQDLQSKIDDIQSKINATSSTLSVKTKDNSRKIQRVLNIVRNVLIVVAAVMLLLAFIGFLLSVFGVQCLVYTLVVLGWLLVAGTFVLCGVFLLLHNVVGDTCVSMEEWVQNPTAHTALDDILPCVDNATAQDILTRSKNVTYQLVGIVDQVIGQVANHNYPPSIPPPLNYNQSGPLVPALCNPFNSDLSSRTCASGEVDFKNATEVWKSYVCQVSGNNICTTTGRLTPQILDQMNSAVNVSYGLYHYTPFLVDLMDCTFARQTFSDITRVYCPGLRKYTQWIYVGLVIVSAAVMFSLIFWVIYARERRHRVYTKQFMNGRGH